MIKAMLAALLAVTFFNAPAFAETFEVKMLNKGEKGSMVFEPDYLALKPGDRVRFIPTHKSHNAATIDGMIPEGATAFKSKINDEFEVGFDVPGFYGIKCSPHYGMGMVMLIKVGDDVKVPESYRAIDIPSRSKPRMDALLDSVDPKP